MCLAVLAMKPAVITPYYQEDEEILRRSYLSVKNQSVSAQHFYIGDGVLNPLIDTWSVIHLSLPKNSANNGNTPRCLGALLAASLGYDPIFFLDADNYYLVNHIQDAICIKEANPCVDVVFSGRQILLDDGTIFYPAPEDRLRLFADTSTMCFFKSSFSALWLWGVIPKKLSPICDRLIYESIFTMGMSTAWTEKPSMVFESHYKSHYQAAKKRPIYQCHDPDWNYLKKILPSELSEFKATTGLEINIQL